MSNFVRVLLVLVGIPLVVPVGCQAPPNDTLPDRELTTGVVQREIRKGMSAAEVAEALGSPNIVARDKNGRETWIYEKFAREVRGGDSQYWLVFVWGGSRGSATTQRTLTVIIKFDGDDLVSEFAFHSTSF